MTDYSESNYHQIKTQFFILDCKILNIPQHGWIEHANPPFRQLELGDTIESGDSILYICEEFDSLVGPGINLCENGNWENAVSICKRFCAIAEINLSSLKPISCRLNDSYVSCSKNARPGTTVNVECGEYFENSEPNGSHQALFCGNDGQWSPTPKCGTPICGKFLPHLQDTSKFPWIVDIIEKQMDNNQSRCKGTIISSRVVITSLSYFYANETSILPTNSSNYHVRIWEHLEEEETIDNPIIHEYFYEIEEIKVPVHGSGSLIVRRDIFDSIILLVLKRSIGFKLKIMPVCLFPHDAMVVSEKSGLISFDFANTNMTYLPKQRCEEYVNELSSFNNVWNKYSTKELICVGNIIKEIPFCPNVHGHSWFYGLDINGQQRYYLGGIYGLKIGNLPNCRDSYSHPIINVQYYKEFILSTVNDVEDYSLVDQRNSDFARMRDTCKSIVFV